MRILNNIVAIFVILIVGFIIIPLPPFLLDMMFIINITISVMILLMTMYVKDALQFSIFPSMLLITTLFRLALNISSTRLILTQSGKAGQVIETFGSFVLRGNVIVGFIIFLIIVIVNFLVITKGAERVSEVSARFKLDAMPGKQMAIDADLSGGLIDESTARQRRQDIQREAEFYGAMDGATKFVKGDAIASIIITFINFIAGTVIGMVQGGSTFQDVLNIYSIATVGDGLVSQLPALLISTATGMIVTRAASDSSLSMDVSRQFFSHPIVMIISGFTLVSLCFIPGMPIPQILIVAAGMLFAGFNLRKKNELAAAVAVKTEAAHAAAGQPDETDYFKNIDNIYDLLKIDVIEMEFGYSLIPLVDENSGSSFIERLVTFRKQFAMEMGIVIPAVRLRDNGMLNPNQYVIKIKGEEVSCGEILVDYYLALDPGNLTGTIDGIETIEPAYGIPSKWITKDKKEMAEIYGYTVIDPLSVVVTHLSETVKKYAHELFSRQDLNQLLETIKKTGSTLVDDVIPNQISFGGLQKVLCNLLKEGVPIRDMETILETISDNASTVRDLEVLTEYVRQALKRTITRKWSDGGQIRVITLDSEVERLIINSISKNDQGTYLSLDPQSTQKIVSKLMDCITKVKDAINIPIVLTSPLVRIYFSKMLEQFYPNAVVLSFNELNSNVQIQAVANVTLE
ncbi:flagellar biosynthesis protein FlhA [Caproiciproducens faecalis]|uniref:Flagellar biosynthesis protein FlhA n=1 Tax=Caproiciproducens faecalis TaxID=2820301 RepID=A0ABS7DPX5_9FIRM|nr:flagellar biosynthesis protein FlhA [Caproiciproducens faecalis]MBW7573367.1 flagellar biosynthesis protein FlhA [Caproiciproducens faecalis]